MIGQATKGIFAAAGTSPHVIANTIKRFLLTLPEPLLTFKCATKEPTQKMTPSPQHSLSHVCMS
jgi:hypothetical protein